MYISRYVVLYLVIIGLVCPRHDYGMVGARYSELYEEGVVKPINCGNGPKFYLRQLLS